LCYLVVTAIEQLELRIYGISWPNFSENFIKTIIPPHPGAVVVKLSSDPMIFKIRMFNKFVFNLINGLFMPDQLVIL
jgi:hypothetical protein